MGIHFHIYGTLVSVSDKNILKCISVWNISISQQDKNTDRFIRFGYWCVFAFQTSFANRGVFVLLLLVFFFSLKVKEGM